MLNPKTCVEYVCEADALSGLLEKGGKFLCA